MFSNLHDAVDKIRNKVEEETSNETTFQSNIAYLPGGFSGVSSALKTLARMKKNWAITVEEAGENCVVGFEDQLQVTVPKTHLTEFATQAFGMDPKDDLYPSMIIELEESLCEGITEAKEPEVEIDELVTQIGDQLLHLVHQDPLDKAYENLIEFKKEFDRSYKIVPMKGVACRVDDENTFGQDIQTLKNKIKEVYAGDRGSLEMILEALRGRQSLLSFGGFAGADFLYGFQAQVVLGGKTVMYQWTVDFTYNYYQKMLISDQELLALCQAREDLRVAGTEVFPVGSEFDNAFFRELHQAMDKGAVPAREGVEPGAPTGGAPKELIRVCSWCNCLITGKNDRGEPCSKDVVADTNGICDPCTAEFKKTIKRPASEGAGEAGYDVPMVIEVTVPYRGKFHKRYVETAGGEDAKVWATMRGIASVLKRSGVTEKHFGVEVAKVRGQVKARKVEEETVDRNSEEFIPLLTYRERQAIK